ncbi:hypothetical protein BKE38_18980 [Pseudoroseomonas deserti]|uniref:Uncharacterized protein n=1 Tax=Teichococcus deserti TaxID=1817963 RepID=A0A1V2GZ32_9PROT|nr:hypothetical protein BKE38_18980 [Pseudoroseomonas deserti]
MPAIAAVMLGRVAIEILGPPVMPGLVQLVAPAQVSLSTRLGTRAVTDVSSSEGSKPIGLRVSPRKNLS